MELVWRDDGLGLEAVMVVDDTTLGPPVGGTRSKAYPSFAAATQDARALARAMTLKCAVAGLDAGGLKIVVRLPNELSPDGRHALFEALGRRLADVGFPMHTAGDFGTTVADLSDMARYADCVHLASDALAKSTGRGVVRCVEVCAQRRGRSFASLSVAVQGCGDIGAAVATALHTAGARVMVADVVGERAQRVASALGCEVVSPNGVLLRDVDIVLPCAIGGVIDERVASALLAWGVVGAANNVLTDPSVAALLGRREILADIIASAGAVVDGVGALVMGLDDRSALIDGLGGVLARAFDLAEAEGLTTVEAAERLATQRLSAVG